MEISVRSTNAALSVQRDGLTFAIADFSTCFSDQHRTGGDIPRAQLEFEERVEPTGCDVG
jgi:hypothetical protein